MNEQEMREWQAESVAQAYERFEGEMLAESAEIVAVQLGGE